MSLSILLRDELNGFYRSKVMVFLWVGLPVLAVLLYLMTSDLGDISVSVFTSVLVSTIGGVIASAMLAVSIINEKERHVYDLFVIRPIKRWHIVLSKFFAVYVCIAIAGLIALVIGNIIDVFSSDAPMGNFFENNFGGIIIILSMMAISCSAGVLIGIFSPSVLVGVILVIYGGNQLTSVAVLPVLMASGTSELFPLIPGAVISTVLLLLSIFLFNRKQL